LSGLSKAYGLPGLRLGWLATKSQDVLERVLALKDYTTICSSAPGEILGIIGLRARSKIIQEHMMRLRRNLAVLDEFAGTRPNRFRLNRPSGGSICFPRLLGLGDTGTFCDRLVRETGIMLVPSSQFQFGSDHVRIGFGRQDFPQVLTRFGDYLDRIANRF
jgi:aspartate/methionine/tyrosine aminotransferase